MGKSDALSHRADHGTGGGRRGRDNDNLILLCLEFFAAHAIRALSGLSLEGEECDILWEIHNGNHTGRQQDAVAKAAEELWKSKGKSIQASEWSEHDGLLCFWDCIYVPNDLELCCCITSQHHDTKVTGHLGTGVLELLVAADVTLHQSVHNDM